jgi:hypothetical protein
MKTIIQLIITVTTIAGVANAQNVGIGTNTPANKLEIKSDILNTSGLRFTNLKSTTTPVTANNLGLSVDANGDVILVPSSADAWLLKGNSNATATSFLGTTNAFDLIFKANATEYMRILNTNGFVGIGTATPTVPLTIQGNINNDLVKIQNTNNNGYSTIQFFDDAGAFQSFVGYGNAGTPTPLGGNTYWGTTGNSAAHMVFNPKNIEKMRLTNTGFLGIGTATPSVKLEVSQGYIKNTNDGFAVISSHSYSNTLGHVAFMGLAGGGTEAAPTYPLLGRVLSGFIGRDAIDGLSSPTYGGADMYAIASENYSATNKGTYLRFSTTPNGTNVVQERLRIENNGNVGIGTATPNAMLNVNSNASATAIPITSFSRSGAVGWLSTFSGATASDYSGMTTAGDKTIIFTNDNDPNNDAASGLVIAPWSAGANSFKGIKIMETGNVGIGTNAPLARLCVIGIKPTASAGTGAANDGASQLIVTAGADGATYLNDWPTGWGGGIATWDMVGSETFFNAYLTRSDIRLKKEIKSIDENIKASFLKLNPVTYLLKKETPENTGLQYGFIAQEVAKLYPSIVTKDSGIEGAVIGMNYQALIAPTVYMVQHQQQQIITLQNELKDLSKKYETLLNIMDKK